MRDTFLKNKTGRQFEFLYFVCYCGVIVTGILSSTQLADAAGWSRYTKVISAVLLLGLMLGFLLYGTIHERMLPLLIILGITSVLVVLYGGGSKIAFLSVIVLIIAGTGMDFEKGVKAYFITAVITAGCIFLLYRAGVFREVTVGRVGENVSRSYLGFEYTTILPNYFFHIVLAYFFLKNRKIRLPETVVIAIINRALYQWTDTKIVYYEVLLLLGILWLNRIFRKLFQLKVLKWCMILSMPVFAALVFWAGIQYNEQNLFMNRLNTLLSRRLEYANQGFQQYGIPLFGAKVEWSTGKAGYDLFTDYFYVDSSYLNMLFTYGLILLVIIVAGFVLMTKQEYEKKDYGRCIVLTMLALHSLTDPQLFEIRYDPFLTGIGSSYLASSYSNERKNRFMENTRSVEEFDREIPVGKLFCRSLLQWRKILAVSLLISILFGGYRVYSDVKKSSTSVSEEARKEYEEELENYNKNKDSYTTIINNLQDNLQSKRDYLSNSILAKVDPNQAHQAVSKLMFTSGEEETSTEPGIDQKGRQILGIYETYINDHSWDELAEKYDTDPQYISELITVTPDYDANSLEVKVFETNAKDARDILEHVLEYAESIQKDVQDSAAVSFQMKPTEIAENTIVETTLRTWATQRTNEINDLESAIRMAQQSQSNLERPSQPSEISRGSIVKNAVKEALILFVLLIAGLICLIMIIESVRNVVLSREELSRRYGIRNITLLDQGSRKYRKLDRAIRKLEGTYAQDLEHADCSVIRDMILEYSGKAETILLAGHHSEKVLQDLADHLNRISGETKFILQNDLKADREGLENMNRSDAVILVETVQKSKYRKIDESVVLLNHYGKNVIGTIVFV